MAYSIIPVWSGPDGDTGPIGVTKKTDREVETEVAFWLARGVAKSLRNLRIMIVDDLTWRKVATVRPKVAR